MKTILAKTIYSILISSIFLFLAFGSGSDDDEKISELKISGGNISFTYTVGFWYTSENLFLCGEIYDLLKDNDGVKNIKIKIIQHCEDKYGKKQKFPDYTLILDSEWIRRSEYKKYVSSGDFCRNNYLDWTPRYPEDCKNMNFD